MDRTPKPGEVVLGRGPDGLFALCDHAGVPQIICDTFTELLLLAVQFTSDQRTRLWYVAGDRQFGPVADAALLQRIWTEMAGQPGRRVNTIQARALWGINQDQCAALFDALVALNMAGRNGDGEYLPLPDLR